jgi:uncharacterized repeat protein (TIGR01451 family)
MTAESKRIKSFRLFWAVALGLGLTAGLLWAFTLRSQAEGQVVSPGSAVPARAASDEAAVVAQASTSAPPASAPASAPPAPAAAGLMASEGSGQPEALLAPPLPGSADLAICMTTDRVWGIVGAGETVTVTVGGVQMGAALANDIGFFWTTLYDTNGNRPNLSGGTQVRIYTPTQIANVTLRAITGTIDVVDDVVSGTIGGVSSPISVTVYAPGGEPAMTSYSQTISTDASGSFSADFAGVWDSFYADDSAVAAYVENSVEVHRHVYATRIVVLPFPLNSASGWATPGSVVTTTVYSDATTMREQVVGAANASGRYEIGVTILTSDTVFVELADGTVLSRTVYPLTENVDAANDRITGIALPGATVRGVVGNLTPLGWRSVQVTTTAATGVYTLEFSSIADIMPGQWAGVHIADAEGDDLALWGPSASVEVNRTYNEVSGHGAVPFGLGDGWPVTLTLYSAISDTTFVYSKGMEEWYGWYTFNRDDGLPDIAPGDVVTVESEGSAWQGVVAVMTMTVQADHDANQFTGTVEPPTQRVELSAHYYQPQLYPAGGQFAMLVMATSPFTAAPAGLDVRGDLNYEVVHRTAGDYVERISRRTDGIGELINSNSVGGAFNPPGVAYTITLYSSSGGVKTQVNGNSGETDGGVWLNLWDYGQEQIEVGDYLQGQSAAGFTYTVQIPAIAINPDLATNIVSGQGPANALLFVSVNNQGQGYVPTDGSGQFAIAVDQLQEVWGSGDLEWGDDVWITYYDESNTWLVCAFRWPQIVAHYDMEGGNEVWGNVAIAGNTIHVTVTHPVSDVIATGTTAPGTCDWCWSPTGYVRDFPDGTIAPSNTVTVNWGDGFVDSTEVVTITANPDVDTDIVTGTAPANGWLDANAGHIWGDWVDINNVQVDASGIYTLNFGAEGWDIQYGDQFNIHYNAVHGHQTQYSFWVPAPELSIDKWNTRGHARPGGVVVYGINYWNDGNGVATDTLIVDTLPVSTTWAGDTSGVTPVSGPGGVITWNIGDLNPWESGGFMVTLDVSGTVPTGTAVITQNCAVITTTTPGDYDLDNNGPSCTDPLDVWDDEVEIDVDKGPNPDDPTPGQEFEYTINWCNNRGTAAGSVWLTDTLPLSTTFLSWSPQNWQEVYWTEVVTTGGQLVFYAPGLPGDMCQEIYLRLLLDASVPISTYLHNTVVITTPGDVESGNNERVNTDAHVSGPRYDMNTDKWYNSGVLVPGGRIRYGANYWNAGNVATQAWITDALLPGTSYRPGSAHDHDGQPFEPIEVTADYVVWDLGVVPVNDGFGFDFTLDVSDTVTPATVLTNCVTVGITATEDTPWDNTACVTETINASGPNLRVRKWREWYGDGQLGYRIHFENIGNQTVSDVWITDTLPLSTTWDGGWDMDFDWGRLVSDTQSSDLLRWQFSELYPGDSGWLYFNANLDDPNDRPRWYTNTVEIDTPPGDVNPADNAYEDVAVKGEVDEAEIWMNSGSSSNMWGRAMPDTTVTVTTAYTQVTGWADSGCGGCWNIDDVGLVDPGDTVTVEAGSGIMPVVIDVPGPFAAYASSITDTVWGQIGGWTDEMLEVHGDWSGGYKEVPTDASGVYMATYGNVPRGGSGYVRYVTEIDYSAVVFHRPFQTPDLVITVDYADDWVNGNYEAGHTVWLTLTESNSTTVKATSQLTTGPIPDWGGDSGFQADGEDWFPQYPDILPGDWAFGLVGSASYTTVVHVGNINGEVDVDADTVSGTIDAPWLAPDRVAVNCEIHEDNGPDGIQVHNVDPDGGSFWCDFGGTWDIQPGHNVAVNYVEPDGDRVQTHPSNPAPDLRVEKWVEGGEAAPGGTLVFGIRYWNEGDGAGEAILTDTLHLSTTYVSDSSGFPANVSGNVITWNLGSIAPYTVPLQFQLVLTNTASPSDTLHNDVDVGAQWETDWDDNHAEAEVHINDALPDLYANKNPEPGDPAPGQLMRYNINYGNEGPVASGPVWLTDTLPLSTTFVSWESDNDYTLWSEVITTGGQFVLYAPSVPGDWGDTIYLTLRVSDVVTYNTQLLNTVEITTTGDSDPDDNMQVSDGAWVSPPRYNLSLDKSWGHGSSVPGGTINYWINYSNNGNSPVHDVLLTDTLPAGTTFITSLLDLGWGVEVPFPPSQIVGDRLVWDLGNLDVNDGGGFLVRLRVNTTTTVGTVFTNCATIGMSDFEDDPYDNDECVAETVRSSTGPDLDVTKYAYWQSWDRIQYQVRIRNVGGQAAYNVTVTETYPLTMTMNWWNVDCLGRSCSNSPHGSNPFTVTFEALYPGDATWLDMELQVPAVPNGTFFTNTAEIDTPPGDTIPANNSDEIVVGTGPDLRVEKWLTGGSPTPKPRDLLTFTLHFQNDSRWWTAGNVWITDTLSSGLEFVSFQERLCGGTYFCQRVPDYHGGGVAAWDYGQMGEGWWNDFVITVLVTDTAQGGDVLTNTATIATDDPVNDAEPDTANNTSAYAVTVLDPVFAAGKVYAGNRVAGTVVTYTLTVTNTGNEAGTGVVLSDTLPPGLTYGGSDGTPVGGDVTWTFANIAANGGTATGWFSAILPCVGAVTNDDYRVVSSDEGVDSLVGVPVAFGVIAPTLNAAFDRSATSVLVNTTVYFTDTSTTNGVAIDEWEWDFGDGSPHVFTQNASHAYNAVGTHTVRLVVTDTCGYSDAVTHDVIVASACVEVDEVSFNYAPVAPVMQSPVSFTAVITPTSATSPVNYTWSFGDGGTGSGQTVQHVYADSGSFTVAVTATNACSTQSYSQAVTVAPIQVFLPLVVRNL